MVPHHSTDCAIASLTSEIGRDLVRSGVYGRSWKFGGTERIEESDLKLGLIIPAQQYNNNFDES